MNVRSTRGINRLRLLAAVALSLLPMQALLAQQTPAPSTETIKTEDQRAIGTPFVG